MANAWLFVLRMVQILAGLALWPAPGVWRGRCWPGRWDIKWCVKDHEVMKYLKYLKAIKRERWFSDSIWLYNMINLYQLCNVLQGSGRCMLLRPIWAKFTCVQHHGWRCKYVHISYKQGSLTFLWSSNSWFSPKRCAVSCLCDTMLGPIWNELTSGGIQVTEPSWVAELQRDKDFCCKQQPFF